MIPGPSLLWLLAACSEPAPRRSSVPVPTDEVRTLRMDEGPVKELVSQAELERLAPALAAGTPVQKAVVEGVLNTTVAPCLPCQEAERSIAACLREAPAGCENLPALAKRASQLALAGAGPGALRAALRYAEPWTAEPHRPLRQARRPLQAAQQQEAQEVLAVELWLDPGLDPWREAVQRAAEIQERAERDPHLGPLELQLRVLPSGRGGEAADRKAAQLALLRAEATGSGLPFARCLAAEPGIDAEAIARATLCAGLPPAGADAPGEAAAAARRAEDIEAAGRIGLRAAPSWRVDGYRLRGHRDLGSIVDLIENQRLDHLAELPAPLLESWSAEPPMGSGGTATP